MKRILCIATAILVSAGLKAQPANNPLPSNPDTLRILAIGNSFSDDGTEYLPGLLEAAGIHNVIVARLYIGGCTLQRHCKEYESAGKDYIYYKSTKNVWETVSKEATILDGLKDEPWDIVTLQQASGYSGKYDSFVPWLPKLIDIVRKEIIAASTHIRGVSAVDDIILIHERKQIQLIKQLGFIDIITSGLS